MKVMDPSKCWHADKYLQPYTPYGSDKTIYRCKRCGQVVLHKKPVDKSPING